MRLLVDTLKDATTVPVAAIQRGPAGIFVYRVKSDDTVEIRVVELGETDGEKVAIVKGLEVGDEVVIDGTDRLRDGSKIRRPTANASGRPVAAAPPDGARPRNPGSGNERGGAGAGNGERRGGARPAQTNQ